MKDEHSYGANGSQPNMPTIGHRNLDHHDSLLWLGQTNPTGTILIIEDDLLVCEALTDLFEVSDFHTIVANDGWQGISLLKENLGAVDVVLLDIQMPGMDGLETLAEIQNFAPAMKVILSSGFNRSGLHEPVVDGQDVDFIQKPYDFDELLGKIHAMVDRPNYNGFWEAAD